MILAVELVVRFLGSACLLFVLLALAELIVDRRLVNLAGTAGLALIASALITLGGAIW